MATFRPLSRRDDETFDAPVEGVPGYLAKPLAQWIRWALIREGDDAGRVDGARLQALQVKLKLKPPFDWMSNLNATWAQAEKRILKSQTLGLDIADALLRLGYVSDKLRRWLADLLSNAGSVWEVHHTGPGKRACLTRRVAGPVREAIEALPDGRGARHLEAAWAALRGREPSASDAYGEAVKAVEAAAQPVVSPSDPKATLGKMISALRDKPGKWDFTLAGSTAEDVAAMCDVLWKGQHRHGTADEGAPLANTMPEADTAVYLALALVRLFTSGAVARR